jgi:hypothetical protein
MSSTLITGSVWRRIKKLSKSPSPALVAVPYFGCGASDILKLREGSLLVVKFDREAIGSGQVDPREVVKAIKRGVEVHSCSNLHAKVYIFGNIAVVGSSNVSRHSENNLLEACIETTERKVVSNAKKFVRSLLGDKVGLEYAEKMIPFYRPPLNSRKRGIRIKGKKKTPSHSDLWLVSLVQGGWQDVDYDQEEKGTPTAEKAMKNPRSSELEVFRWSGGKILERYKVGQRVIQCTKTNDNKVLVSPPSRIVSVRRYTVKGKKRAIVYLEVPKKYRRRQLASFLRSLGASAKKLGNPRRTKQLRDPDLIYTLGRLWT